MRRSRSPAEKDAGEGEQQRRPPQASAEGHPPVPRDPTAEENEPADAKPKVNVVWANIIKEQHTHIRDLVQKHGGDTAAAWNAALEDDERLDRYAQAMRDLAVQYWDQRSSSGDGPANSAGLGRDRYNDRLGYIVGAVRRYYCGVRETDRADGYEPAPPGIAAAPLKADKRAFFQQHARQMTAAEADASMRAWIAAEGLLVPCTETSVPLIIADVGSCYNPLPAVFQRDGDFPLLGGLAGDVNCDPRVLGVDLAPHPTAGDMVRCDWTQVTVADRTVQPAGNGTSHWTPAADAARPLRDVVGLQQSDVNRMACTLAAGSIDVVSFCLLLSYMPTPEQRARCIENAHRVLKRHGLLVIVSTRTQGKRGAAWIDEWVAAIEQVGFARVDKSLKAKLVGLSFRKTTNDTRVLPDASAARLKITADVV